MKVERIVVGLDWRSRPDAVLAELARLADRMQAELIGLFIVDIELLHLAALPFAREVGFPSAVRRELDLQRMERAFEALADELRRSCEAVLEGLSARWSFRVARGSRAEQLLSAATEAGVPTLLVPPGADVRAQAQAVRRSERDAQSLREMIQAARHPILIIP